MKVLVQADLQHFPFVRFKFIGVASRYVSLALLNPAAVAFSGGELTSKWIKKKWGLTSFSFFSCENCIEYLTDDNSLGVG